MYVLELHREKINSENFFPLLIIIGLHKLAQLTQVLKVKQFGKLRRYTYAVPGMLIVYSVLTVIFTTFITKESQVVSIPLYVKLCAANLLSFIPAVVPSSFVSFLWIFSFLFEHYINIVRDELAHGQLDMPFLRQLHADLRSTISTVINAYGIQVSLPTSSGKMNL